MSSTKPINLSIGINMKAINVTYQGWVFNPQIDPKMQ
jgi:hypothetical protein